MCKNEKVYSYLPIPKWKLHFSNFINKFGFLNGIQFLRYADQFDGECSLKLISLIPLSPEIFRSLINIWGLLDTK